MSLRAIPFQSDHHCFACGHANPQGLHMEFFTDEQVVVTRLQVPATMCGWSDVVHGGILSTILDELMSNAAIYLLDRIAITRSIQVDFHRPVRAGQPVQAEARVLERVNERKVQMVSSLTDPAGTLCASARGILSLFTPERFRTLGLSAQILDDFETFMRLGGKR